MPKINQILTVDITPEKFLQNCSPLELREVDMLIQTNTYMRRMDSKSCVVCGCTDYDCKQCIEKTGKPCHWVTDDLCSACAANVKNIDHDSVN